MEWFVTRPSNRGAKLRPRKRIGFISRTARPPSQAFDPLSPRGRRHGRTATSTDVKKTCSLKPRVEGTPDIHRLQSLYSTLEVCEDDLQYRLEAEGHRDDDEQEYSDVSNLLFLRSLQEILAEYAELLDTVKHTYPHVTGWDSVMARVSEQARLLERRLPLGMDVELPPMPLF